MKQTLNREYWTFLNEGESLERAYDRGIVHPDFVGSSILCTTRDKVEAYIRKWDPKAKPVKISIELTAFEINKDTMKKSIDGESNSEYNAPI